MTTDRQTDLNKGKQSFAGLLRELDHLESEIPDVIDNPAAVFRYVYDGWVKGGGSERGKRRHSVRQIQEWLGKDRVPSLETKLAGQTWLQFSDAFSLLRLFLSYWRYDKNSGEYTSYAPVGQLDDVTRKLLTDLFPEGQEALLLPERRQKASAINTGDGDTSKIESLATEPTRPSREAIADLFAQSDALITISRARTVIGSNPPASMTAFHDLLQKLYDIDIADRRKRALIWIIDLGLRNDELAARAAIYNLHFLTAQFRAIALIDRSGRNEFYSWLLENACIIVGSLEHQEINRIYCYAKIELPKAAPNLMWFQSDSLFLDSVPGRWIESKGSEALGQPQRKLWQTPTITAHLKLDEWPLDQLGPLEGEFDIRKNLRYLFHAEAAPNSTGSKDSAVRCISLPDPGSRWSDAYQLAYTAAFGRLESVSNERAKRAGAAVALAQLRHRHFAVLKLDEFLKLSDLILDCA